MSNCALYRYIQSSSKPEEQALRDLYYQNTLYAIQHEGINKEDDFFTGAIKLACMLTEEKCAQTLTDTIDIKTDDYFAFMLAQTKMVGDEQTCVGIYKTWKCF